MFGSYQTTGVAVIDAKHVGVLIREVRPIRFDKHSALPVENDEHELRHRQRDPRMRRELNREPAIASRADCVESNSHWDRKAVLLNPLMAMAPNAENSFVVEDERVVQPCWAASVRCDAQVHCDARDLNAIGGWEAMELA